MVEYRYNDNGYRTYKKVISNTLDYDEHFYYLNGDKVLYEKIDHYLNGTLSSTDEIYYTYDVDGTLISMNLNGEEYFYIRNIQGDIIALADKTGKIRVEYFYDAWGNSIRIKEYNLDGTEIPLDIALKNPYRYRGYRYDEETKWYYLNSRYYNPEIGRFINADGLIGSTGDLLSHNLYAYCVNNPVMLIDTNGDKWIYNRFSELSWPGEIHDEVQNKIARKFGLKKNYLYMDLYLPTLSGKQYVWEVKPISYLSNIFKNFLGFYQLSQYLVVNNPVLGKINYGYNLGRGKFYYKANNGHYYVVNWYSESYDGMIFYTFKRWEKEVRNPVDLTTAAKVVTISSAAIGASFLISKVLSMNTPSAKLKLAY